MQWLFDGDPMKMIGTLTAGIVTIVILVGLVVSFIRRLRVDNDTPWRSDATHRGDTSSVAATELESMRHTLGLPPKADDVKDREQARQMIQKSRFRRLFGK